MNVDVYFTTAEVDTGAVQDRTAVVIDVVRASSTIVEALANGARAVYPASSTEDALKLASSLGRDELLLCGERKGLKIDGFDLGNSPAEFTRERVQGKRLVMSTTNGTRALAATAGARRVVVAAFLNLGAVIGSVAGVQHLSVICAGSGDLFSLDDAVCAGHLLKGLEAWKDEGLRMNDAGLAARRLADLFQPDGAFLLEIAAGRALVEIGLGTDLELCARRDAHTVVPEMEDRVIRLPERA